MVCEIEGIYGKIKKKKYFINWIINNSLVIYAKNTKIMNSSLYLILLSYLLFFRSKSLFSKKIYIKHIILIQTILIN